MKVFSPSIREVAIATIAAVLAALILGAIPTARNIAATFVKALWHYMNLRLSLTLPAWGWALVAVIVFISVRALLSKIGAPPRMGGQLLTDDLDALEKEVMRILAAGDGQVVRIATLTAQLGTSHLRATKVYDNLAERGLITVDTDMLGPQVGLTRRGRDYALMNRLA
jgi:predicted transcriptional regulator